MKISINAFSINHLNTDTLRGRPGGRRTDTEMKPILGGNYSMKRKDRVLRAGAQEVCRAWGKALKPLDKNACGGGNAEHRLHTKKLRPGPESAGQCRGPLQQVWDQGCNSRVKQAALLTSGCQETPSVSWAFGPAWMFNLPLSPSAVRVVLKITHWINHCPYADTHTSFHRSELLENRTFRRHIHFFNFPAIFLFSEVCGFW